MMKMIIIHKGKGLWKTVRYISLLLFIVLLLTGCGAAESGGQEEASKHVAGEAASVESAGDPLGHIEAAPIDDPAAAAEEMTSLIKTFKAAVESDNRDDAIAQAERMASIWKSLSQGMPEEQSDRLNQMNADLGGLLEAVHAESWDKARLVDLDYSLYQGFRDVKTVLQIS
ncbi:hypothetical protein [Paenibacillus soyae]|uniref:Uncharacterized protein n=1 Tax=Paenibacillus soyae TaxID=2969249 RepID=A0A9X2MTI9_9BACL|nr:hypothetical protein [Paenibacillus soyae]MCR2806215.1 hypothetical protein [Paenibacillus soyae]